jgi:mRNA interferase RelE/StbE
MLKVREIAMEKTYHPDVKKVDLPKIDPRNKAMIKKAIEERLLQQPEIYGKPLRRTLKGYWKLRVGDYRIVFKITKHKIFILGIIPRKDVYPQVDQRSL